MNNLKMDIIFGTVFVIIMFFLFKGLHDESKRTGGGRVAPVKRIPIKYLPTMPPTEIIYEKKE